MPKTSSDWDNTVHIVSDHSGRDQELASLCRDTFTASEGEDEGNVIGTFVEALMNTTPAADLFVFSAYEGETPVGAIFFSRLTYSDDPREVFILSPVAVKTQEQRKGIGQQLITHGLAELRKHGVSVTITYGDPNYYSKVGFSQITEDVASAPLKLNFPHGWLGQSLVSVDLTPLKGTSRCVHALNSPELW